MLATARNIHKLSYLLTPPYTLNFGRLSDEQFETVCRKHPDLEFELSAKGELIIMPPTLPDTGWKNTRLITRTDMWSINNSDGIVFDSSTIFTLPNGAKTLAGCGLAQARKMGSIQRSGKKESFKDSA